MKPPHAFSACLVTTALLLAGCATKEPADSPERSDYELKTQLQRAAGWAEAPITSFTYNYNDNYARATVFKDGEELDVGFSRSHWRKGLRFSYYPLNDDLPFHRLQGVPRDLSDWDLATVLKLNTTSCIKATKQVEATALPGGHTAVQVNCDDRLVATYVDDHELTEHPRPWTTESLTQLLSEIQLINGSNSVFIINLNFKGDSAGDGWEGTLEFTTAECISPTGKHCISEVKRNLRLRDYHEPLTSKRLPTQGDIGEPLDIADLDPAAIQRAIHVGSEALGWADENSLDVEIRRAGESEPHVEFSYNRRTAVVNLDGELIEIREPKQ